MLEPLSELSRDYLPKLAVAAILPSVQAAWHWWKSNQREERIDKLRKRITELNQFLSTAPALGNSEEAQVAVAAAQENRDSLLRELAGLRPPRAGETPKPLNHELSPALAATPAARRRSWVQRAFLLYAPMTVLGWALHVLAYFSVVVLIRVGFQWDEEAPSTFGVWLGFLAILFWLARLVDTNDGVPRPRSTPQKLLLWYWPDRISARVLHIVIYTLTISFIAGVIASLDDWDSDSTIGVIFVAVVDFLFYAVARRLDRDAFPSAPRLAASSSSAA